MTNRSLLSQPSRPLRAALRGLALAAALTGLACVGASAQPSPITPSLDGPAREIAGGWRVTQVGGAVLATDSRARLEFRGRDYSGNDGCNQMSGRLSRASGGHIRFGMAATTRMACEPAIMKAADALHAALAAARGYRLSGARLTLSDARGGVVLLAEQVR